LIGSPAKTWDSYKDLLLVIFDEFHPKKVIEFGSGMSTYTISDRVEELITVEHDENWFVKIPKKENIKAFLHKEYEPYREEIFNHGRFDLVFIDGNERQQLLMMAEGVTDLVLLHDADRFEYKQFIDNYTYHVWNDAGCTVALTNDGEIYDRLRTAYENRDSSI